MGDYGNYGGGYGADYGSSNNNDNQGIWFFEKLKF